MPLFFNNKRKDAPMSPGPRGFFGLENLKGNKSTITLNERPQTSGGVTDTGRRRKEGGSGLPFVSKWPSTNGRQPALSVVTGEETSEDDDQEDRPIGVALGSPSESLPPVGLNSSVNPPPSSLSRTYNPTQPQEEHDSSSMEASEEVDGAETAKVRRWRTVSGLFARRKAAISMVVPSVVEEQKEEQANATPRPQLPPKHEGRRKSISFKRARKSQAPSVPDIDGKYRESPHPNLPMPTPGDARAYEADDPAKGPSLDIDIPDSGMDRYSVMFSNCLQQPCPDTARPRQSLLARRTGTESLTIVSPTLQTARSISPLQETSISPERMQQAQTAALPIRTYSLAPTGPQCRLSAVPAPLFSQKPQKHQQLKHSRSAIGILTSDAAPTSPDDPFAVSEAHPHPVYPLTPRYAFSAPETPPESPVAADDTYSYISSQRNSTISTASSPAFPPSPTSSHGSYAEGYFLARAATLMRGPLEPTIIPTSSSNRSSSDSNPMPTSPDIAGTPPQAPETERQHPQDTITTFLALPSPDTAAPHTPWDLSKAFPSPINPSSSPSPRLKFGYDTPHSPLISIAKAVTVCVKTGQGRGQRPQFVVRQEGGGGEEHGGRSAEFVRDE